MNITHEYFSHFEKRRNNIQKWSSVENITYDSRMRASERQHEIEPKNIKNKTNSKSNQNLVEVH